MKNSDILDYLDLLFPNPKCELNYDKDYELLIVVMLSAQTTDKAVNNVSKILFDKYDSLDKLKDACVTDIANIIKPIGTYNRKAEYVKKIANIIYNQYGGKVPRDRVALEKLPGVGRKVANVVLSEWFNDDYIAVDTHVLRVSKRLGLADLNDDALEVENRLMNLFDRDKWKRLHLQLVLFGRYYCKSKNPKCNECRFKDKCGYKEK